MVPHLPPGELVAVGSRGRVTIDPPTFRLVLETRDGTEVLDPPGNKQDLCFAIQLQRFLAACANRRPVSPGLADGLASLDLTERIARAAGPA
jgi:predicted dehydrogenase